MSGGLPAGALGKGGYMPIFVSWDDEAQSITRMDFVDHWSWEEYFAAVDQVAHMAQTVDHRVDHISDLADSAAIPSGALRAVARSIQEGPTGPRMIVIAGGGVMVEVLIGFFRRLFPRAARYAWVAESLDDARALIARVRAEADAAAGADDPAG